jgi:DNA polymerase III delta subunit
MKLDYFGFRKTPVRDRLRAVSLVVGKDEYLRRLVADDLVREALGEGDRTLNLIRRSLAEGLTEALDDLRTPSLLGGARVVHLREVEGLDSKTRPLLEAYLKSPAPGAYLILEGESLHPTTRLFKAIQKGGVVVVCRPLYETPPPWGRSKESEVSRWIRLRAKDLGRSIGPVAVDTALEAWGADLAAIDRALEAASLLAGEDGEIREEQIRSLAPGSRTDPIYKVVDAALEKKQAEAARLLRALLLHGGSRTDIAAVPHILIRGLHRRLTALWSAHRLRSEGKKDGEILQGLGIATFLADRFWAQVRLHPPDTIPATLGVILETERSIKTGEADPQVAAESLIARI